MLFVITTSSVSFQSRSSISKCSERHLAKYLELEKSDEVRILRHELKEKILPISGNGHIVIQPGSSLDEIKIMEPETESTLDLSLQLRQEKLHTDQIVNYDKGKFEQI